MANVGCIPVDFVSRDTAVRVAGGVPRKVYPGLAHSGGGKVGGR